MPAIILGGIYGGVFTATEVAAVSVVCAAVVCILIYRQLNLIGGPGPESPGFYGDLMVLAEIARFGADVGENGRTADLVADAVFVRPAARLIEAVLQFGQSSTQSTV
jgi:hypothetical protein